MATTLASGSKHDITIVQGATFSKKIQWKDANKTAIDMTGYTARMQIRAESDSAASLFELTTENGRILLNSPTTGDITLKVSATDTAAITFNTGVYDLELVHTDGVQIVDNILYGYVSVRKNVTR